MGRGARESLPPVPVTLPPPPARQRTTKFTAAGVKNVGELSETLLGPTEFEVEPHPQTRADMQIITRNLCNAMTHFFPSDGFSTS